MKNDMPMSISRRQWFAVAVVVAVAAAVGSSAMAYAYIHGSSPMGYLPGGYGSGPIHRTGMMGGSSIPPMGRPGSVVVSPPVAAANDTLTFSGDSIELRVLMGPMAEGQSMYSFLIDNHTNPTLVIPRGARVTMTVVNVDTDAYHGLTLTQSPPPYANNFMPMMMSSLASTGALPPSSGGSSSRQISFTVSEGMYYVCPVPGHAQSGMYGQIRVG